MSVTQFAAGGVVVSPLHLAVQGRSLEVTAALLASNDARGRSGVGEDTCKLDVDAFVPDTNLTPLIIAVKDVGAQYWTLNAPYDFRCRLADVGPFV